MKLNKTSTAALLIASGILMTSAAPSFAGPGMGSTLGECYNNWVSWCNEHSPGYPNDCYTKNLKRCDNEHKNAMSQIPATQVKSMKTNALRKAKRSNTRLVAPTVQPVKRSN